eukprot:m.896214 g.896214  ORF g.896214 m.896214 type:complete len:685 (+) comp23666_c0_seq18:118-2172(+)
MSELQAFKFLLLALLTSVFGSDPAIDFIPLHHELANCSNATTFHNGECFDSPSSYRTLQSISSAALCCSVCGNQSDKCGNWVFRDPAKTQLNPGCQLHPHGVPGVRVDPLCVSGSVSSISPSPPPPPMRLPPTYWCTWQAQSREWMSEAPQADDGAADYWMKWRNHAPVSPVQGYQGWDDFINETFLAQNSSDNTSTRPSWVSLFPRSRHKMILVLDNGWGSGFTLNTTRFPMFAGASNENSLAKLSNYVKSFGWRGVGLWLPGSGAATETNLRMAQRAGIRLLKLDGSHDDTCSATQLARAVAPDVYIEYGTCANAACPLNGGIDKADGRWPWDAARVQSKAIACADLFRTYDMVKALSVSEVLDRQYKLLNVSTNLPLLPWRPQRHFGGSGEHMVTASLGGVMQPMDSTTAGLRIPRLYNTYVQGPPGRQREDRIDEELERLTQWSILAPPFGVGIQANGMPDQVAADDTSAGVLWDSWHFGLCDDACTLSKHIVNTTVYQGAPGRITRGGLPLPTVVAPTTTAAPSATPPFIVITRFPANQIMITAMGRTSATAGWTEPTYDVTVDLSQSNFSATSGPFPPIGIFGRFASVSLVLSAAAYQTVARAACGITGSDLLDQAATTQSIRSSVVLSAAHATVTIPGAVLARVGTAAAPPRSRASPGMLLTLCAPPAVDTHAHPAP